MESVKSAKPPPIKKVTPTTVAKKPLSNRNTTISSSSITTGTASNVVKKKSVTTVKAPTSSTATINKPSKEEKPATKDPSLVAPRKFTRDKYDKHKLANILEEKKKYKTNFSSAYHEGRIPCRINHGGVNLYLQWDKKPQEGLKETEHPYTFVSRIAFKELLEAPGALPKVRPFIGQLAAHIRTALREPKSDTIHAAMDALKQLSDLVQAELNPFLNTLLIPLTQKMKNKDMVEKAQEILSALDMNGGDEAFRIIKSKVPMYSKA